MLVPKGPDGALDWQEYFFLFFFYWTKALSVYSDHCRATGCRIEREEKAILRGMNVARMVVTARGRLPVPEDD